MSNILSFILVFCCLFLKSKKISNELQFKKNEKFISKIKEEERNRIVFNILPIEESDDLLHIRILFPQQIIDLKKDKNNNYEGFILNRITQYNYSKKERNELKTSYVFFKKEKIHKEKTIELIDQLISSNQINLPSDSLIENWNNNYLHCYKIQFQYKNLTKIKRQKYNCPLNQNEENEEIKTIANNIRLIKNELKLDSIYSIFENSLPLGKNYSYDGYRTFYRFSKKEQKAWEKYKPYRQFLKLKKDTIDNYLKSLIQNTNLKSEKINCFETYHLNFTKKRKLKKISIAYFDKPKWKNYSSLKDYLSDKKEIKKCKKTIAVLFQNSDLSFIKLKHDLYRSISFNLNGNAEISDNTIY